MADWVVVAVVVVEKEQEEQEGQKGQKCEQTMVRAARFPIQAARSATSDYRQRPLLQLYSGGISCGDHVLDGS